MFCLHSKATRSPGLELTWEVAGFLGELPLWWVVRSAVAVSRRSLAAATITAVVERDRRDVGALLTETSTATKSVSNLRPAATVINDVETVINHAPIPSQHTRECTDPAAEPFVEVDTTFCKHISNIYCSVTSMSIQCPVVWMYKHTKTIRSAENNV